MQEVLVLGAGYAGLKAVRQLQKQKDDFHITLIDRNSYHYEAKNFMRWRQDPIRRRKFLIRFWMLLILIR